MACEIWQAQYRQYKALTLNVIDQTERRVMQGEQVPSTQKIVSLFEEHTDISVKGRRDIQYGHKLNLSTGRSGLILDVVIEEGNPADSEHFSTILNSPGILDLINTNPIGSTGTIFFVQQGNSRVEK